VTDKQYKSERRETFQGERGKVNLLSSLLFCRYCYCRHMRSVSASSPAISTRGARSAGGGIPSNASLNEADLGGGMILKLTSRPSVGPAIHRTCWVPIVRVFSVLLPLPICPARGFKWQLAGLHIYTQQVTSLD
jgi:hypothetical protein